MNAPRPFPIAIAVPGRGWRLPLLALLFAGLLWPKIDSGTLWQYDETLTANRCREMVVRGDPTTLTWNFAPDFRKPPLAYWLGALCLRALPTQPELAVRLPSLFAGAACLLALGLLARAAYPNDDPALACAAALALAGCGPFIHMSRVALLDTGAALCMTLAVAGCLRSRADPRWWWFTGFWAMLGALEKAPYAFGAWAVVLVLRRRVGPGWAHLAGAWLVALAGCASWWAWQAARHGGGAILAENAWQVRAMTQAHDPGDVGFRPYLYLFWLARDWALVGVSVPLAVAAALWRHRRRAPGPTDEATAELGWICAVFALGLACIPFRAERYLIVILPLCALLCVRWLHAAPWRWLLPLALLTTLPVASFHFFSRTYAQPDLRDAARDLARGLGPQEAVVIDAGADPPQFAGGLVAFYADLRHPWHRVRPADAATTVPPVCRGVCLRRQWATLLLACPDARPLGTHGDWIAWARGEE